jgi:protein ImuA
VLPDGVAALVWRGNELGGVAAPVRASGWAALDRELPGGGWPGRSLTEVLCTQFSLVEWRLLVPALRGIAAAGGTVVAVGPPLPPHPPGLMRQGLDERHLLWVQAATVPERLWVSEQLLKSQAVGAVLVWLPQVSAPQLRRLQACALGCEAPVFVFRPEGARAQASAASLRVHVACAPDWALHVHLLKRRGPAHAGELRLPCVPGGLAEVLTPRTQRPGHLIASRSSHAVGRLVARRADRGQPIAS